MKSQVLHTLWLYSLVRLQEKFEVGHSWSESVQALADQSSVSRPVKR